jgi:hypothetical protein
VAGLARPVSSWIRSSPSALTVAADALKAPPEPANVAALTRPALPRKGKLDPGAVMKAVAHYLLEGMGVEAARAETTERFADLCLPPR